MHFNTEVILTGYGDVEAIENQLQKFGFQKWNPKNIKSGIMISLRSRDSGSNEGEWFELKVNYFDQALDSLERTIKDFDQVMFVVNNIREFLIETPTKPSVYLQTGKQSRRRGDYYFLSLDEDGLLHPTTTGDK